MIPALAVAQQSDFQQQTVAVLRQYLQQADSRSGEVLEELAREAGLAEAEVRARLLGMLDTLEVRRKQGAQVWEGLVHSGGEQVPAKAAEKFLRRLVGEGRRVLGRQGEYSLGEMVEKAAQQAQIPAYRGREFLLRLLNEGPAVPSASLPEKVGLLVEVRSEIEDEQGYWYVRTAEGKHVGVTSANLLDFLLPLLLQELQSSPHVRWVVTDSTAALKPDCWLVLELDKLEPPRGYSGEDPIGRYTTKYLTGSVVLYDPTGQVELYRQALRVNQYTYIGEPERNLNSGSQFMADIASKVRAVFDNFWAVRE